MAKTIYQNEYWYWYQWIIRVFWKTMENIRKHRDIKLITTEKKKKPLGVRTKLSYYKVFHRNFICYKMRKTQILMNKTVYLGWSI